MYIATALMSVHSTLAKLLLLIVCFVDARDSYCQSAQILNFEKLTINDGLSQGFIYNINQDDKGFMWFCTPDGLNRYDGYHFKIYRHDEEDSFSVSSNFVTKFFLDSRKNAWVGTQDNGLNYFDIVHQSFYHFFPGQTIGDILEDKYGNLLINYRSKIILVAIRKIEGDQLKKIQIDTTSFTLASPTTDPDAIVTHRLFTDTDKNIYLSSRDGIYKLAYGKNLHAFKVVRLCSFLKKEEQPPKVTEDKASHRFYTHLNKHLVEFSGNNFSDPVIIASQPNDQSIFIDSKRTIWYGASQINLVNAGTKTIVHVVPRSNDIKDFLGAVYTAFEDRNGNIWLGTSGLGILKFSGDLDFFHHALPDTYVYHLQAYDKETVLVEGLYKVKISNNGSVNVDTISLPSSIKTNGQSSQLIIDSSGCYWLFADNQLKLFNPKNNNVRIVSIKEKLGKQNSALANVNVQDNLKSVFLFPDSRNNIWFQCFGKMMSYNIKTDSLCVYASLPAFEDVDKSFRVIYEDHQGVLWITTSQDFYSYNPSNRHTHFFYHSAKDSNSVAGSNASCFCDDPLEPSKFLWIGTRGSGLSKMNKLTGKCVSVSTKNGLPNNVIYGLLADDEGNLWGSTNKGLFKLDVRTNCVKNFDVTDGLQGNEFNRYAYLKLPSGELIFGGLNGISYFKAKDVHSIPPPTVSLTNIRILNKNLSVKDSGRTITEDVSYLKQLSITSSQNIISFEFAAMDYRKAGAVHYRYRLNGFDDDWSISDLSNTATYTNLNPGNYTFCVQASNDNITWSITNTLLNLHVLPMWWQTWFFKTFIGCCVLAIGYVIYRYRLQQLLRIERMRNNIARDLHDEIGSSLSSISIFSKLAQRRVNTKEADPGILLQKINEDARHVMDSMSDIVWSINTKNDELENVFYRMREHATQLLEAKNYTVHFGFDERLHPIKLDMQSRRDFYLIYKEALNNIAKYADGKNVWITLSLNNNKIELDIKDDGRGFDQTKMHGRGNGLFNMQKRADANDAALNIVSKPNEGVTLHLSFPKK